ncbi:hypothetical protein FE783_11210 [Paenibacillus mesophilus]|uniref:hypothetical protein n=1 Tax=Paenibacillus mesophilus TaxID=2582849 RepID=UPI00110E2FBC|nr:hypothetical protein [Paenibacillus mesophilus]TMV50126.1 hypothetical protein FE783_11210 [Paenibacillus mesophilus]
MYVYALIIIFFVVVAAISTIMIGTSKQNREGNPDYDTRTGGNMVRLTTLYIIAAIIGIAILLYMIF